MITAAALPDLIGLVPEEAEAALRTFFTERGHPHYRVAQVLTWLYEKDAISTGEMTNLPRPLRDELAEAFQFTAPRNVFVKAWGKLTRAPAGIKQVEPKFHHGE